MRVEDTLLEIAKISILNKFDDSFKIDKADLLNRHTILSRKRCLFCNYKFKWKIARLYWFISPCIEIYLMM